MTSPFVKIPKKIFGVPVVVGGNPDFGVANDFARMPPHRPGGQIFIETCMCNALFKFNSFKCCKIVFSVAETTSGFGRRPTTQFCDTNTLLDGHVRVCFLRKATRGKRTRWNLQCLPMDWILLPSCGLSSLIPRSFLSPSPMENENICCHLIASVPLVLDRQSSLAQQYEIISFAISLLYLGGMNFL